MREAVTKLPEGSLPESNEYKKLKPKVRKHGPSSAERHPILSLAMKFSLAAGALSGCSGANEAFHSTETTPSTAPAMPDTTPPHTSVTVELNPTTTVAEVRIGPLSPEQRQTVITETGITELSKVDLSLVSETPNAQGGKTKVFGINGATPFETAEEVNQTVNNIEQIAAQRKEIPTTIQLDGGNMLDVNFVATPTNAVNHYFFFGGSNFLAGRDLPDTFGNTADPSASGVSYIDQYNPKSKTASSFLTDATQEKIMSGKLTLGNYSFNVEACQNNIYVQLSPETTSSIQTNVKDTEGQKITADRLQKLGQELTCGSMGLMRAYKQAGFNYDHYKQIAELVNLDLYKPLTVPFTVYDQATWDQL